MKEFFRKVKADILVTSIICIILGCVLLFYSDIAIGLVCSLIAATLILLGCISVITFLTSHFTQTFSLITGLLLLILGIWFWRDPAILASIIPCVIGLILVWHGCQSFGIALETKKELYDKWWGVLLASIVLILLGVFIIVYAFYVTDFAVKLLGVALIYDAISNFVILSRAAKVRKAMKQEAEAIDTEGKEIP